MRLSIGLLVLFVACGDSGSAPPPEREPLVRVVGRLGYKPLDETSGLARSMRDADLLWAVNDDGAPVLYGIGRDGRKRGKVEIRKAGHRDWEDLAAFELDGIPYLLVADVGDNDARRRDVTVYVVEEPDPGDDTIDVAWEFDFSYPDGPRDTEAVAVDAREGRIYVLSKRDIPPRLYSLPLRPDGDERLTAEFLARLDSLPLPTRNDVNAAPLTDNWHWQPTGMSMATDGRSAIVLTYGGVYLFRRSETEGWPAAFGRPPLGLSLRRLRGAESITLDAKADYAYITTEGSRAPILRVDLRGAKKNEPTD